jgi:hypothetical protein
MSKGMNPTNIARTLMILATASLAHGAPTLSLEDSAAQSSATVADSATTITLTLRFNTDGNSVSGLGYILTTDGDVNYGAPPAEALGLFVQGEQIYHPAEGGSLPSLGTAQDWDTETAYFRSASGDYAAGDYLVTRHVLNIQDLGPGTYVFTPEATQFTNSTSTAAPVGSFATGSFALTVTPVPEPTALSIMAVAVAAALSRRRNL